MNIDKLLEKQGKTRYWLAKQIGVSYPTMVRMSQGEAQKITLETIYKMVEVLECSFDDLFKIDNN